MPSILSSDIARPTPTGAVATGSAPARLLFAVDRLLLALPPIVLIASVVAVLVHERSWWVDVIFDDGYYYLGIARGLADQHRSWFLPPFETNGYQPLWQLILWASATLFGTTDRSLVVQALTLNIGAICLFCAVSRAFYGLVAPAVLAALHFTLVALYGMETALLPALVVCFFHTRDWRLRGGLSALIFLTRLDALALVVASDLVNGAAERRLTLRHYAILGPVVGAYAALNLALFGVPVPVSGLMKAVGNVRGENLGVVLTYASGLKYPLLAAGLIVLTAGLTRTRPQIRYRREMAALLIAQAAAALYYGINSGWNVWGWYFWPAMLLDFYLLLNLAHLLAAAISARGSILDLRILLSLAACLVLVIRPVQFTGNRIALALGPSHGFSDRTTSGIQNVALVDAIRAGRFPDGTYFAMGDRAGSFGFFLDGRYRFLHTEGLVGPTAYYRAMRADAGKAFVEGLPIDYLVTDRTAYLKEGDVLGVIEPVQGISSHQGPYLLCFPTSAIAAQQSYAGGQRYVFSFARRVACPAGLEAEFSTLRARRDGVRSFSVSW